MARQHARIDEAFKDYANYFDGWQTSEHAAPVKQLIKDVLNYCKPDASVLDTATQTKDDEFYQGAATGRNGAIDEYEARQKELGLL